MTDNIKLAAIKLKGIGSADREWILKQLSPQERGKLDPVLAELDTISFDQVIGLGALVNINEDPADNLEKVVIPSLNVQEESVSLLTIEPDIVDRLRKTLAQHSDMFLSILVSGTTIEKGTFLSQVLDRTRHLRVIELAKNRSNTISPRLANIIRLELIKTAESGVGDGRNI